MPATVTQAKGESDMTTTEQIAAGRRAKPIHCSEEEGRQEFYAPAPSHFGVTYDSNNKPDTSNAFDFLDAPEVRDIARQLIDAYPSRFGVIRNLRMVYYWKRDGGKSEGKPVYGKCVKVPPLARALSVEEDADEKIPADFVIWLAADHINAALFSRFQLEALIYHELCHVDVSEKGKPALLPHDFEGFKSEILEYGDWKEDLQHARDAFTQLPLWQG